MTDALLLRRGKISEQFVLQAVEERLHAGCELRPVRLAVGRGGGETSGAPGLHERVQADEVHGVLDAFDQLSIDPRVQVTRLLGISTERGVEERVGHGASMRCRPVARGRGVSSKVE